MSLSETGLCRKLLETLHLSVSERQALPDGRARFSVLLAAAADVLRAASWLPPTLRPSESFDGVVIEARPDGYWLHERHEVGVGRFSPVESRRAEGLAEAVEAYPRSAGGAAVDGVPIDYGS